MFNNPFSSFHATLAEAKRERERLDRLLIISTPRERQLVAAAVLAAVALAGWLLFGSVGRNLALDGVLIEPGDSLLEGNRPVQALVWVESELTRHLDAGMPAAIELGTEDGEVATLDGKVAAISAVDLSKDLAILEAAAPMSVRRVSIALDSRLDLSRAAGSKCRIVIEIGRFSPLELLRLERS